MDETDNRKEACLGGGVASLESWKVLKKIYLSTRKRSGEKRIVSSTLFSYIADLQTALSYKRSCLLLFCKGISINLNFSPQRGEEIRLELRKCDD